MPGEKARLGGAVASMGRARSATAVTAADIADCISAVTVAQDAIVAHPPDIDP